MRSRVFPEGPSLVWSDESARATGTDPIAGPCRASSQFERSRQLAKSFPPLLRRSDWNVEQ